MSRSVFSPLPGTGAVSIRDHGIIDGIEPCANSFGCGESRIPRGTNFERRSYREQREEETPVKSMLTVAAALILIAVAGIAEAKSSARYCLRTSAGPGDCRFSSFKQCQAASSGVGGTCVRNRGPR
jgi:hypothetical protein